MFKSVNLVDDDIWGAQGPGTNAGPGGCNLVVLPRDGLAVVFGQGGGVTAVGV